MRHPDDYRDEMERLSSQEAEEILSGGPPSSAAARGADTAVKRLRSELLAPLPQGIEERHLAAMRAAAANAGSIGDPMRKRTTRGVAALGLAATLVLGAGLAAALTLPEQASDVAKERVAELDPPVGPGDGGQEEPSAEASSDHGKAVSAVAKDDSTKGCDHGRAVSEVASSKAEDNRKNEGDHPGGCGPSQGNGAAASAAKGSNGNHGQGNNGNHGAGDRGNRGVGNDGSTKTKDRGQYSDAGSADAGSNAKNELPHGLDTAPGQTKDDAADTSEQTTDTSDEASETGDVTEDLPAGA